MAIAYDIHGFPYGEPPYTPEEQLRLANQMNAGVRAFTRLSPRPALTAVEEPKPE